MPIVQMPHSERVVVLRCHGEYGIEDVMENIASAPGAGLADSISIIFDVRDSKSPRSRDDFRRMVRKLGEDNRYAVRHASVINLDDQLYFGLTRQIQAMADNKGIDYGLFGSIEEAVEFVSSAETN